MRLDDQSLLQGFLKACGLFVAWLRTDRLFRLNVYALITGQLILMIGGTGIVYALCLVYCLLVQVGCGLLAVWRGQRHLKETSAQLDNWHKATVQADFCLAELRKLIALYEATPDWDRETLARLDGQIRAIDAKLRREMSAHNINLLP